MITLPEPGLEDFEQLIPGIGRFILDATQPVETSAAAIKEVADNMLRANGYLAFASQQRAKYEIARRQDLTATFARLTALGPDGKPLNSATADENLKYLDGNQVHESYRLFKLWEALEMRLEGLSQALLSYLRTLEREYERLQKEAGNDDAE